MGNSAQFFDAMLAEISAFGKVLAEQAIGVFVAPALPGALRITEVDIKTCVDPKLSVLCRESHHGFGDGIADGFSTMTGKRQTVLDRIGLPCAAGATA